MLLKAMLYASRLNSAGHIAQLAGATSLYRGFAAVTCKRIPMPDKNSARLIPSGKSSRSIPLPAYSICAVPANMRQQPN